MNIIVYNECKITCPTVNYKLHRILLILAYIDFITAITVPFLNGRVSSSVVMIFK